MAMGNSLIKDAKYNQGFASVAQGSPHKEKHHRLEESIYNLERTVDRLQDLYNTIINGPCPEDCAATRDACGSSFSVVLDNAPDRIDKANSRISELVVALNGVLF